MDAKNAIVFEWVDILYPSSLLGSFGRSDFEKLDAKMETIINSCRLVADVFISCRAGGWASKCCRASLHKTFICWKKIHECVPEPWYTKTVSRDFKESVRISKKNMLKDVLRKKDYKTVTYVTDQQADIESFELAVQEAIFSRPNICKTVLLNNGPASIDSFFLCIRLLEKKSAFIAETDRSIQIRRVRDLISLEAPRRELYVEPSVRRTRFTDVIPFSGINRRFSQQSRSASCGAGLRHSMPLLNKTYRVPEEDTLSDISSDDEECRFSLSNNKLEATIGEKRFSLTGVQQHGKELTIRMRQNP